MKYWLMKSEPDTFGIDHLAKAAEAEPPAGTACRNYQARNMLRDEFASAIALLPSFELRNAGIYGTMRSCARDIPTPASSTARASTTTRGSNRDDPRWYQVEVRLLKNSRAPVTLECCREHAGGALEGSRRAAPRQSSLGDAGDGPPNGNSFTDSRAKAIPTDDRARRIAARCAYLLLAIPSTMYILGLGLTPT
jgi:predicted RNA-binding protein with PUA-like domain